jgi:stalled ribosome rescue protein Dom34
VVWLDHQQARIFHVGLTGSDEAVLRPHDAVPHIHHKANSIGSGHAHESKAYLGEIAQAIADAGEILIIGPAGAKTELTKYLQDAHPAIAGRVVAVEAADHPTDAEIVALARRHFKLVSRF